MREVSAVSVVKKVDSTAHVSHIITANVSTQNTVEILQVPVRRGPPGPPGTGVLIPWTTSNW